MIKRTHSGFTFIELLVTLTIIGIVFTSGVVTYTAITLRSRDTRRKSDLESIRQTLEMCRSLTGSYPDYAYLYQADPDSSKLSCGATGPTLMEDTPTDPKPCPGFTDGAYGYNKTSSSTYVLTAPCMEIDTSYQVTNP